jgi:hypothetical protein
MTEYNVASPLYSDNHGINRVYREMSEAAHSRISPFAGTCRAVQSSIKDFEATLDSEHEVAIRLAPFGSSFEFRAQEIRFSPSDVVTFHGYTETGEKVQLVQHLSQVNLLLTAVRKLNDTPIRVAFLHGNA